MRSFSHEKLLILFIFLIVYLLPLGARDLAVPDETRYAEIPREMIATGDWMAPHLNGVRYFEKPVMGYWIHAVSILIFGENNFAVRFPSALSAGLSGMLIFWLVGSGAGEKGTRKFSAAGLATLIFLTCFEVFGVGNTAVLDNLFALFLTAAIAAFYVATEKHPRTADEKAWLVLAGLATGLAFLTKGFLAMAIPIFVLVPYLTWQRRSRDIFRMGWLPLLTALVVVLPWGVGIGLREPDFWHFFFWNEHIRRFLGHNAQHTEPVWYFLMVAPAMFLPWTFLAPAAVEGLRQTDGIGKKAARFDSPGGLLAGASLRLFFNLQGEIADLYPSLFSPFCHSDGLRPGPDRPYGKATTGPMGDCGHRHFVLAGVGGLYHTAAFRRSGSAPLQAILDDVDGCQRLFVYDIDHIQIFKKSPWYKKTNPIQLLAVAPVRCCAFHVARPDGHINNAGPVSGKTSIGHRK